MTGINNAVNAPFPLVPGQGGTGLATLTAHGILVGEGTSNVNPIVLGAGQVLVGVASADPVATTLNAITWNDVSGTTQAAAVNQGYIISNASQTTVTIPNTAAEGSTFQIAGKGAGGWIMQMGTGQTLHFGNVASSSAGTATSGNQYDSISIVCVTANTTFVVIAAQGNITLA
jgi:hypothetical protein